MASLPFGWLGPVGAYNAVCFLGLALLPLAIALVARELGVPRAAAVVGALSASFGALSTVWLGYVTFAFSGLSALVFLAWLRLRRNGSPAGGAALALAVAATGWCCLQLLVFTLVALALAVGADLVRRRDLRFLARTLAALAAAGLLLLPLGLKMREVRAREGLARTADEARRFSASPGDWLSTTSFNPGQRFLSGRSDSETALYPGSVALALSVLGLASFRRHRGAVGLGLLLIVVGFLGSLGPSGPLVPPLSAVLPEVLGSVRAFVRFAFVGRIGIGILAACGAARLLGGGSRLRRIGIVAGLLLALAVDQRQTASLAYRADEPEVDRFLAAADPGGPILHLPASFRPYEGRYLLASTAHFRPIVNATMSYIPAGYFALAARLSEDPIPDEVLSVLERWPVAALVVHEHALPAPARHATLSFLEAGLRSGRLRHPLAFTHGGGQDFLLAVGGSGRDWGAGAGSAGAAAARSAEPTPRAPGGAGGGAPPPNAAEAIGRLARESDPGVEDPNLPSSIDGPGEGARVTGELVAFGWAQDESGPCRIAEVRVDGDRRPATVRRLPRPDVSAALPHLGDTTEAGWEARLAPRPGDVGPHRLEVRVRCASRKVRTLERTFLWAP